MKNQIVGRFISAFLIMTTALSTAQEDEMDIPSPAEVALPNSAPRGIYVIPKPPWNNAPSQETWENDCLDGVTIRRYWKQLNPEQDEYEWAELDSMFEVAKDSSKKIHLIVAPGFHSPKWVLQRVETRRFTYPREPHKGEKLPLPVPWDPTYLDLWFTFVDKLAKRYGSKPALSLVAVTGPNGHNGEVNLPREASDIKEWKKLMGGGPEAEENLKNEMVKAYRKTIDRFYEAFASQHQKYFSLQIFNRSLPVEDGDIQDDFQNKIIKHASEKPGKYFVLMNASLDGWPFAGHVSKNYPYPKRPPQWVRIDSLSFEGFITGFQAKRPIDDKSEQGTPKAYNRFRDIIKNGIRFGAGFLEIYEKDIDDKNLEDLIAAGSILLKGKCKCKQR